MHRHPIRFALVVLIVLLLASCANGQAEPTATLPPPTPTPRELAQRIAEATQASNSLHFTIDLDGAPVYADTTQLFVLEKMEGDLLRPDGVLAVLNVTSGGGVAEIRSVSLAGQQYITNPITRQWQCLAPGNAFDPAVLFDPQRGIESLLQDGLANVELVDTGELNGTPQFHLRGTLASEQVGPISGGLLGAGDVGVDIWANQATLQATQVVLVDTATSADDPSTWTLRFSDYGKTVDVRAPIDCSGG